MDDSPSYDNTDKDSDSDLDSLYDAIKEHDDIRYRYCYFTNKIDLGGVQLRGSSPGCSVSGSFSDHPAKLKLALRGRDLLAAGFRSLPVLRRLLVFFSGAGSRGHTVVFQELVETFKYTCIESFYVFLLYCQFTNNFFKTVLAFKFSNY